MLRFDALTILMLLLVAGLALVLTRFASRYLAGEPGQPRFTRWCLATVTAVIVLITSNHLLLLALAWTATSLALHQLLTFFPDRPQALIAAHKKFLLSRLADVAIIGATLLIGREAGTFAIDGILAHARALATIPGTLQVAGLLLAVGVILRSAQLPFHGWLIQVMEAPTPVSALLHAGVVNIGGFVLIRLAPLMSRLEAAQLLLVLVGTLTAVVAALVLTTRVSIKVSLAWSTAAQMGFMLVECGLGLYDLALLHLLAHSVYKAHAFLRSGSGVTAHTMGRLAPVAAPPSRAAWWAGMLTALALVLGTARLSQTGQESSPARLTMQCILALALAPLLARGFATAAWLPLLRTTGMAAGLVLLAALAHRVAGPVAPALDGPDTLIPASIAAAGFLALIVLQRLLATRPQGRLARQLYPACYAGFYLDELFTRLTFHLWPPRLAPVAERRANRGSTVVLERAA